MDKYIDISFKASYSTLNELTPTTKCIWIVCHGYGQLASKFIKKFEVFDSDEHFFLAPQGLSRFYLPDHNKVGASWMTKEDRSTDMENQKRYFDALLEEIPEITGLNHYQLNLLGFSQGVSMICRLAAYKQLPFDNLILWAGGFPHELSDKDFKSKKTGSKLKMVLGESDQFYKLPSFQKEIDRAERAVGLNAQLISFEGKHVADQEILKQIL